MDKNAEYEGCKRAILDLDKALEAKADAWLAEDDLGVPLPASEGFSDEVLYIYEWQYNQHFKSVPASDPSLHGALRVCRLIHGRIQEQPPDLNNQSTPVLRPHNWITPRYQPNTPQVQSFPVTGQNLAARFASNPRYLDWGHVQKDFNRFTEMTLARNPLLDSEYKSLLLQIEAIFCAWAACSLVSTPQEQLPTLAVVCHYHFHAWSTLGECMRRSGVLDKDTFLLKTELMRKISKVSSIMPVDLRRVAGREKALPSGHLPA